LGLPESRVRDVCDPRYFGSKEHVAITPTLHNLRKDIGERRNLAVEMPAKVDELRALLHVWRKDVGALMPLRNSNYDPSKPEHDTATRKKQEAGN